MFAFVLSPVSDVRSEPKFRSERIHQLVFGEIVEVIEHSEESDYIRIRDVRINYCGYVNKYTVHFLTNDEYEALSKLNMLKVSVPFCKSYGEIQFILPFGSRLYFDKESDFFLPNGKHYSLVDNPVSDLKDVVDLAQQFLGVPYLWGGTSSYGFDCSGFVNRLYDVAKGIDIPRDAGDQESELKATDEIEPGNLLYMEGHVMMYIGENKIIHANGHDMCVSITDLAYDEYGKYLKTKIRKICTIL
ncbi:C40 family peptidase [Fervidobacterium sp.]